MPPRVQFFFFPEWAFFFFFFLGGTRNRGFKVNGFGQVSSRNAGNRGGIPANVGLWVPTFIL